MPKNPDKSACFSGVISGDPCRNLRPAPANVGEIADETDKRPRQVRGNRVRAARRTPLAHLFANRASRDGGSNLRVPLASGPSIVRPSSSKVHQFSCSPPPWSSVTLVGSLMACTAVRIRTKEKPVIFPRQPDSGAGCDTARILQG